jgi:hypothetical protein
MSHSQTHEQQMKQTEPRVDAERPPQKAPGPGNGKAGVRGTSGKAGVRGTVTQQRRHGIQAQRKLRRGAFCLCTRRWVRAQR